MMYTSKYSLQASRCDVFTDYILVFSWLRDDNRILSIYDVNFQECCSLPIDTQFIGTRINEFYCNYNHTHKIKVIDLKSCTATDYNGNYVVLGRDGDFLVFNDETEKECKQLNPRTKEIKILFKIEEDDFLRYPKFIVSKLGVGYTRHNGVHFLDIQNGALLWDYDLKNYFKKDAHVMDGRVLVVEDRIIFFAHTEDWEQYATFVLDAVTGELLNKPSETPFGGKLFLFDKYIWQKKDKGFAKMDPKTLEITHFNLENQLSTEKIENKTMAYCNGVIAVSAKPEKDSIRSLVLLFDTNTQKIIDKKEILHDETKPSINNNRRQIEEIQMNDKYLVVSVAGNTLYVFEKSWLGFVNRVLLNKANK